MNNQPAETLRALIAEHGLALLEDAGRCTALLKERSATHTREVYLLGSALYLGIPADLQTGAGAPTAALAQRLNDELGIAAELAEWTVQTWAAVLNLESETPPPTNHGGQRWFWGLPQSERCHSASTAGSADSSATGHLP